MAELAKSRRTGTTRRNAGTCLLALAFVTACPESRTPTEGEKALGRELDVPLDIKNTCWASTGLGDLDRLSVHAVIPMHYTSRGGDEQVEPDKRVLVRIVCTIRNRACRGARLELDKIGANEPFDEHSFALMENVTLAAVSGSTYTVQWSSGNTFTVDVHSQIVRYAHSLPASEGRGEARCVKGFGR